MYNTRLKIAIKYTTIKCKYKVKNSYNYYSKKYHSGSRMIIELNSGIMCLKWNQESLINNYAHFLV